MLASPLAFMKFFDPALPEDHPDNYYMEREWRCVRSIKFEFDDIAYVFVASGFRESFTERFVTLASKVHELP